MFPASVLGIMYRNSMRVPSFNELYYNQIGNVNLLPEQANQFSVSFSLQRSNNKWKNAAKLSTYYNNILDKIVAVPTKNLFIWSMQNIGRVQIFGLEGMYENTYHLKTDLSVSVLMTYNYQSAIDVTSRASATYGDQIAYLPKHSGNIDLTFFYKKNGCRIGVTGMDKRYALNENIPSNQVDGFCLIDLSAFRNVEIKSHTLKIHLACRNVLNNSYAYIRYYVMPGRNYQVSLSYAFN
jgi:outer membrane cobalamin receptor